MVRTLATLVALTYGTTSLLAQGKLGQIRDTVDRPNNNSPTTTDDEDDAKKAKRRAEQATGAPTTASGETDDWSTPFYQATGFLTGAIVTAPWWVPHTAWDPGFAKEGRFSAYPFANPDTGFILIDRNFGAPVKKDQPLYLDRTDVSPYTVRVSSEYGSDFNGLDRMGLRLFLDTASRFGIRTDWDYYTERSAGQRDHTWFGDVTATFRFVQNEFLQMHTGVGVRMLLDRTRDRIGGNFLYSVDVFYTKPFHVGAAVEAGWINDAGFVRLRTEAGVNYRNLQLLTGYDYFRLGRVDLHGPFVGLRVWY